MIRMICAGLAVGFGALLFRAAVDEAPSKSGDGERVYRERDLHREIRCIRSAIVLYCYPWLSR